MTICDGENIFLRRRKQSSVNRLLQLLRHQIMTLVAVGLYYVLHRNVLRKVLQSDKQRQEYVTLLLQDLLPNSWIKKM